MKIAIKFPLMVLSIAVLTAAGVGVASYLSASSNIQNLTNLRLKSTAETQRLVLGDYFKDIETALVSNAQNYVTRKALTDFKKSWKKLGENQTKLLQKAYITENKYPAGEKHKLNKAGRTAYDKTHNLYHGTYHRLVEDYGYYDVFIFDTNGDLIYSVFKENDFAENFISGKYKDSGLAQAFKAAMNGEVNETHFIDLAPYKPSFDAPASFMATPISIGKKKLGVLAFQMPSDRIQELVTRSSGLGETGEVLLVGSDNILRSNSRMTEIDDLLATSLKTELVDTALSGSAVSGEMLDLSGVSAFAAIEPIDIHGKRFALVVTQSQQEALAPVRAMRTWIIGLSIVFMIVAASVGYWITISVTKRISGLVQTMATLAGGDTTVEITGQNDADELGDMAKTVQIFKDNAVERLQLSKAAKENRATAEARQNAVEGMIEEFDSSVQSVLVSVSDTLNEMRSSADCMAENSAAATSQTEQAASSSSGATQNVQSVASAAEQLSASIAEISRQVGESQKVVKDATTITNTANEQVAGLAEAATRIGEVIGLIRAVAEKTNLLALNATIEAARAGEAGRGFAVVATEVKELASQTASATEDIASQIEGIQTATGEAVSAISTIFDIMQQVETYSVRISTAVGQQGAATNEISRNILQAASDTQNVASNVTEVARAVAETTQSAMSVQSASEEVKSKTDELRSSVDVFLKNVATA